MARLPKRTSTEFDPRYHDNLVRQIELALDNAGTGGGGSTQNITRVTNQVINDVQFDFEDQDLTYTHSVLTGDATTLTGNFSVSDANVRPVTGDIVRIRNTMFNRIPVPVSMTNTITGTIVDSNVANDTPTPFTITHTRTQRQQAADIRDPTIHTVFTSSVTHNGNTVTFELAAGSGQPYRNWYVSANSAGLSVSGTETLSYVPSQSGVGVVSGPTGTINAINVGGHTNIRIVNVFLSTIPSDAMIRVTVHGVLNGVSGTASMTWPYSEFINFGRFGDSSRNVDVLPDPVDPAKPHLRFDVTHNDLTNDVSVGLLIEKGTDNRGQAFSWDVSGSWAEISWGDDGIQHTDFSRFVSAIYEIPNDRKEIYEVEYLRNHAPYAKDMFSSTQLLALLPQTVNDPVADASDTLRSIRVPIFGSVNDYLVLSVDANRDLIFGIDGWTRAKYPDPEIRIRRLIIAGAGTGDGSSRIPGRAPGTTLSGDQIVRILETRAPGARLSYNFLDDRPSIFSGSYDDLTNKPSIPSAVADNRLIPSGGGSGQILAKSSNSNYAVQWINAPRSSGGGSGPKITQIITKAITAAPHTDAIADTTYLNKLVVITSMSGSGVLDFPNSLGSDGDEIWLAAGQLVDPVPSLQAYWPTRTSTGPNRYGVRTGTQSPSKLRKLSGRWYFMYV